MIASIDAHPEKRSSRRVTVALTAHCQIGHQFFRGPVADLSHAGFYLRTKAPAREGSPVRIAVALPDRDGPRFCTLIGSVARVDQDDRGHLLGLGISLSLQETATADQRELDAFLHRNEWRQ